MEADPLDVAAQLEECERNAAIAKTLMRPQESPDEDEHGRYCLAVSILKRNTAI